MTQTPELTGEQLTELKQALRTRYDGGDFMSNLIRWRREGCPPVLESHRVGLSGRAGPFMAYHRAQQMAEEAPAEDNIIELHPQMENSENER